MIALLKNGFVFFSKEQAEQSVNTCRRAIINRNCFYNKELAILLSFIEPAMEKVQSKVYYKIGFHQAIVC